MLIQVEGLQLTEVKGMSGNIYYLTAEELRPLVLSLQESVCSKNGEIAKLAADQDVLVSQNHWLEAEYNRLTNENAKLRQDVEKLTKKLAQETQ